jgi:integrase
MKKVQHSKGHPTKLLFPDVLPKPRKRVKGAEAALPKKIGETLDDFWRESLKRTLDGNPRKLCMHSLRHYVNNHLIHSGGVHEVTRLDLLGHVDGGAASQSINTSTYRDETGVKEKLAAITALPRIF